VTIDLATALATCNALLSAISLGFAIAAYRAIRRKQIARHRNLMLVAVAASAAFLVLFVIRFVTFGFEPLNAGGAAFVVHKILLFSHEPLAVINVPLVVAALVLGLRRRDRAHREVAPMAFWIWIYVLVTGILLYALLYLYD
jgi:putative membrane protein